MVGPLFPTEIRVTLRCKEHDVGSEFEIGYFEWGAKRDVKKYYGYTEEDSAIAMQVGDWKWSQEKSKEVRDFYEERFGHRSQRRKFKRMQRIPWLQPQLVKLRQPKGR